MDLIPKSILQNKIFYFILPDKYCNLKDFYNLKLVNKTWYNIINNINTWSTFLKKNNHKLAYFKDDEFLSSENKTKGGLKDRDENELTVFPIQLLLLFIEIIVTPVAYWLIVCLNKLVLISKPTALNQDLTSWCVTNIAAEPDNFALNSAQTNANKPVCGTCP